MERPALILTRVSTGHQEEGYSLQTQREQCRLYAQTHGFVVVAEFEDIKSGMSLDRNGLSEARRLIQRGEVAAIIVFSPDRLTRSIAHAVLLREEFRRCGVELHYVTRGLLGESAEDTLTANIEAVFAEYWREKITEATQRGKRAKIESGQFPGSGQAPYGYRIAGEKRQAHLEIVEEEARIVRLIFHWYAYGDERATPLTIYQVAQKLTELGICSPGEGGKKNKIRPAYEWNVTSIHRILRHAAYKGVFYAYRYKTVGSKMIRTPPESWVPVSVPAIVDEAVWTAAQLQMDAQRSESKRNVQADYLLRAHVRCGCGYAMHCKTCNSKDSRNGVRYARLFYRCHGTSNRSARVCPYKSTHFSAKKVDAAVWAWMETSLLDEDALRAGYTKMQAQSAAEIQVLEEQRMVLAEQYEQTRQQLERLLDLYLSGAFDKSILSQRKETLQRALDTLQQELEAVDQRLLGAIPDQHDLEALLNFVGGIKRSLSTLSFEQRRRLVEILNVQATLTVEEGKRIAHVISRVDRARIPIDSDSDVGNPSDESVTQTTDTSVNFGLQTLKQS